VTDPGRDDWSNSSDDASSSWPQHVSEPVRSAALSTGAPRESDIADRVEDSAPVAAAPKRPRKPTAALAWMALGIAALFAVADVVAIVLAVQRSWETATLIAQASNLGTAIAFIAGLFAIRHRPGRRLGIAAMVLAVIANPFILTHLLAFLGGS
jgi:uncharacterized membrane protein YcjF (UPF0283 family)